MPKGRALNFGAPTGGWPTFSASGARQPSPPHQPAPEPAPYVEGPPDRRLLSEVFRLPEECEFRAYLAGPMRGYPQFNFPAFREAAAYLRQRGLTVVSPAEHDLAAGFNPETGEGPPGYSLKRMFQWDLIQVINADLVVVLPFWALSQGTLAEVATAKVVGVPVYAYADLVVGRPVVALA